LRFTRRRGRRRFLRVTNDRREDEDRDWKKPNWTILHNKFPPTPRVGLVRPRTFSKRRIAQLSFFFLRRSFFGCSRVPVGRVRRRAQRDAYSRMRWTGQIFWLLAFEAVDSL